jgi:hypothetical protein
MDRAQMKLEFNVETPEGKINFTGSLNKDEVDFLLRYAIVSLMSQGILPVFEELAPSGTTIDKKDIN